MRVAVIGAGIGGLACAYELCLRKFQPVVYEAGDALGGLAQSFRYDDVEIERFYHHLYTHDRDAIEYIRQAGLAHRLVWKCPQTSVFYTNRVFKLSSPADLLRFAPLPVLDRARMGLVVLWAQRRPITSRLDMEPAAGWLRRRAGSRAYAVLWEPLLRNKFGPYHAEIAASWLCSKFQKRGASRGRSGREVLGYLDGGFSQLFRRLAAMIQERGGEIRLGASVSQLHAQDARLTGLRVNGTDTHCDAAIFTGHVPQFLRIAPDLPEHYREKLSAIRYLGNVCLVLFLNRSLSSTYWMNVNDPAFPFVCVVEHSQFVPTGSDGQMHVVYLSKYVDVTDPLYRRSAAEVLDAYEPYLQLMFPEFSRQWVKHAALWKARYAQPLITVGYRQLIPELRTPVRGLYLSTMAQIYPDDRQMSNAIKSGRECAALLAEDLRN